MASSISAQAMRWSPLCIHPVTMSRSMLCLIPGSTNLVGASGGTKPGGKEGEQPSLPRTSILQESQTCQDLVGKSPQKLI